MIDKFVQDRTRPQGTRRRPLTDSSISRGKPSHSGSSSGLALSAPPSPLLSPSLGISSITQSCWSMVVGLQSGYMRFVVGFRLERYHASCVMCARPVGHSFLSHTQDVSLLLFQCRWLLARMIVYRACRLFWLANCDRLDCREGHNPTPLF